ncbi:MAG: hypothetical protein IID45_09295, partial [Planctomycetes bacterium]|nr:hypothetical protein [Planctomycetota bacterium]
YDRLDDRKKAKEYYLKAKDADVCPLRMTEEMSALVKKVAAETGTPLLDAMKLLELQSPQGIPGSDFYMDHVHPTVGAHQRIARAIVRLLREKNISAKPSSVWTPRQRRQAYRAHLEELGSRHFGNSLARVGWLEKWARRDHNARDARPRDLRGSVHFGHREANLGDEQNAWYEYRAALEQYPAAGPLLLARALELFQQGRFDSARQLLHRLDAILKGSDRAEVRFAALVMAVESGQRARTLQRLQFDKDLLNKIPETSVWKKVFPQTMQQLQE